MSALRLCLERPLATVLSPGRRCAVMPFRYDPKHWRDRAEEMRRLARNTSEPALKRRLLRIAHEYDELALQAENSISAARAADPISEQ